MYGRQLLVWIIVVFVVVEVVLPGITGNPLFPRCRFQSKASKLLAEQERLRRQLEEDAIRQENEELRRRHETNVKPKEEKENGTAS